MTSTRTAFVGLSAILYCGWAAAAVEAPAPADQPSFVYPQERTLGKHKAVLHAPQIESWDFGKFNGVMAIEFFPDAGTKALVGSLSISGNTEVDLAERLVYVTDSKIDNVSLKSDKAAAYADALRAGVRNGRLEVPLDIFLLSLDDAILDRPPPAGFTKTAPDIIVSTTPAIVLFINGKPVLTDLPETELKLVVNANWPLVTDAKSTVYYLLDREVWLTAPRLAGPWTATRKLPKGLKDLPKTGDHALIAAAVPAPKTRQVASTVHLREVPTEILVIDGEPKLEAIPGAAGLSCVTNTESALFQSDGTWYFPVAGRWFSTAEPFKGPWTFVEALPESFAAIPEDHKLAYVRSSVRGTVEAKIAALESLLPKRKAVAPDAKPTIQVGYAGDPKFEPIENTAVSRAVNTGYDVIQFKNGYYLCYAGIWYTGVAPIGPWTVARHVPKEIYAIPPSSPSYHVTQVTVVEAPAATTATTIVYEQTPSYSSNVYVVYGVPWYGTGYYYHPYAYGYYYYPYPIAYGHGNYYNPVTGGYGSRSVWYGPYGGYSYTNGYNPRTGRYGYVETAWDGDEWASSGGTYNPRTGVATETDRYYNEDSNKAKMERRIERGDEWIETERKTDFDQGTMTTKRETSRGGSSDITHARDDAGNRTTSGTIETGGGRTATIEGSGQGGQGTTVISGSEGGSATIERDGRNTRTDFETAGGGSGTSIRNDGNRTTVAEGANGDLYAGRNGNVFKRTDDGWQSYDRENGSWNQVNRPGANPRPTTQAGNTGRLGSSASLYGPAEYSKQPSSRITQGGASSRDYSRLNRDAAARRSGTSNFQRQRAGGYGGGRSMGARPRRR